MADEETVTAFQEFMTDLYMDFIKRNKKRKASDNDFARWLGVSSSTYNTWINNNRVPNLTNTMKIARRTGPRIYDILHYPRVISSDDMHLNFVMDNWLILGDEDKEQIYNHVKEVREAYDKKK